MTKANLSEVAMWPDIACEVYLLTGFCKETGILTGLWLHMEGRGCLMDPIAGRKLQIAFRPPAGEALNSYSNKFKF